MNDTKYQGLKALIETGFSQVNTRFDRVEARLDHVEQAQDEMNARMKSFELAQAEMRGLSACLSSMDNRFMAIMRPYEPPQRSAG